MANQLLAETFLESRIYPDCKSVHVIARDGCPSCEARAALTELRGVLSALRSDLAEHEAWQQVADEAKSDGRFEDMRSIAFTSPEGRPLTAFVDALRIKPVDLDAIGQLADEAVKAVQLKRGVEVSVEHPDST